MAGTLGLVSNPETAERPRRPVTTSPTRPTPQTRQRECLVSMSMANRQPATYYCYDCLGRQPVAKQRLVVPRTDDADICSLASRGHFPHWCHEPEDDGRTGWGRRQQASTMCTWSCCSDLWSHVKHTRKPHGAFTPTAYYRDRPKTQQNEMNEKKKTSKKS